LKFRNISVRNIASEPIIPALRRLRQEKCEFQGSLLQKQKQKRNASCEPLLLSLVYRKDLLPLR
jgi:hypothetical protein